MSKDIHESWQRDLLPFIIFIIVALLMAFIVFYFITMSDIQESLKQKIDIKESKELQQYTDENRLPYVYSLEKMSLSNRYYHARLIIRARILIISFSFLTGTILCFLGAIFVLGKFSSNTELESLEKLKIKLISTSPGIVLSVLGVVLMVTSNYSKADLLVRDSSNFAPLLFGISTRDGNNNSNSGTSAITDTTRVKVNKKQQKELNEFFKSN